MWLIKLYLQVQAQILQPQSLVQTNNILQQQPSIQNHQSHRNVPQNLQQQQQQHQQQSMGQNQQQNLIQPQLPDQVNQQLQMSDNQIQLLQKFQQQQQSLLAQQSAAPSSNLYLAPSVKQYPTSDDKE